LHIDVECPHNKLFTEADIKLNQHKQNVYKIRNHKKLRIAESATTKFRQVETLTVSVFVPVPLAALLLALVAKCGSIVGSAWVEPEALEGVVVDAVWFSVKGVLNGVGPMIDR